MFSVNKTYFMCMCVKPRYGEGVGVEFKKYVPVS
jgi:hypothetical protein